MFFTNFERLCKQRGKSTTAVGEELGISKTTVSYWRNNDGAIPKQGALLKIADYFGVPVGYLLGQEELVNGDGELTEYLEELKGRNEMRMLFSVAKTCTKEEVEQAVRIIEALRKENK